MESWQRRLVRELTVLEDRLTKLKASFKNKELQKKLTWKDKALLRVQKLGMSIYRWALHHRYKRVFDIK